MQGVWRNHFSYVISICSQSLNPIVLHTDTKVYARGLFPAAPWQTICTSNIRDVFDAL